MPKPMTEARAWRECAAWCERGRVRTNGLCYAFYWCNGTKQHWPTDQMLVRVQGHARGAQFGAYLHYMAETADSDYFETPHARVIFCLLMALECEDEVPDAPR